MTQMELITTDKKIRHKNWEPGSWMRWTGVTGCYITENGYETSFYFDNPEDWEYYEEPKPKRKMEFEEWVCVDQDSGFAPQLIWIEKDKLSSYLNEKGWRRTGATRIVEIEE